MRAAIWSAPSCCGTSVVLCAHPITPSLGACRWELSHLRNGVPNSLLLRANNRHKSGLCFISQNTCFKHVECNGGLSIKTKAWDHGVIVFMMKQPPLLMIIYLHDSGRNVHGRWIRIVFTLCSCYVHRSPFSLSDSPPEVTGTGNPMKYIITLNKNLSKCLSKIWRYACFDFFFRHLVHCISCYAMLIVINS